MVAKPDWHCQFQRGFPVCYAPRSGCAGRTCGWGFLPKFSTPVEKIVENQGFKGTFRPRIGRITGI